MFKLVVLSALLAFASSSNIHAPVAYTAPIALPSAVSYQARTDFVSKPVIATTAYAAAPVVTAYSAPVLRTVAPAVAVPSAVSYQSRTDVINKPLVSTTTYTAAAPIVEAPVVQTFAPVVKTVTPVVRTVAPAVAVPSAVSYQSRTDVISKPVVSTTTYAAAPVVPAPVLKTVAPVVKTVAPVVEAFAPAVAIPSAVSYQSRTDVINKPVVATTTYAAAAPVVAAPVLKTIAPAVVSSYAAPAIVSSYAAPANIVTGYHAPAVAYAAERW